MAAEGGAPQPKEFRKIAVFCGASSGSSPVYIEAAKALGEEMVRRGIGLVYGGRCTPNWLRCVADQQILRCRLLQPLAGTRVEAQPAQHVRSLHSKRNCAVACKACVATSTVAPYLARRPPSLAACLQLDALPPWLQAATWD